MPVRPWTTEEDDQLRALHAAGRSLHSIAKELGRAKSSVHDHAKALGITWDRTATAAAATAVAVDNKARRGKIVTRIYDDAEAILTAIEDGRAGNGWQTILKGEYGTEHASTLPFIPSRDRRDVADVLSRHITSATKLEAIDATDGVDRERSLLGQLGEALGVTGPTE